MDKEKQNHAHTSAQKTPSLSYMRSTCRGQGAETRKTAPKRSPLEMTREEFLATLKRPKQRQGQLVH